MAETILIVEDERDLAETLAYNLERAGFQTRIAMSGAAALELAQQRPIPELALLDLMLPDFPGTEVCRRLRQQESTRDIKLLIVSAKGEEIDRVVGFELGADDYVVKPYSIRELILRIRAVLRRSSVQPQDPTETQRFGCVQIDMAAHQLWVEGEAITLTALEFRLASVMFARRGRVQTRDTLLSDVWGIEADITTRTVDTHVKRLRQKLGPAGDYIETLRGVGYRWRALPHEGESPAVSVR